LAHEHLQAFRLAALRTGISSAAKTPMMTIVTNNSRSVNRFLSGIPDMFDKFSVFNCRPPTEQYLLNLTKLIYIVKYTFFYNFSSLKIKKIIYKNLTAAFVQNRQC
jgi:hypothetical protein